ncbi:MAG: hypothetical protein EP344_02670 [Bacteroidetes bacterium]|nr:MAG: hypothetical protein EP344_02670 [Bacteroidota bacterium]
MQKRIPYLFTAVLLCCAQLLSAQPKIELVPFATTLNYPVDIANCGDSRLFIVEQNGYIRILDSLGNEPLTPFLNIDDRVRSTGNEQGLLGLAFAPDYAQSGIFYVYYTREPDGDTRVSRFSVDPDNPDIADPNSEEILLIQDQPYNNHNGGCIKFGPDGYLYIALGDGGSGGDPQNYGQTKNTLLGKILRIDVNSTSPGLPYGIPADNPFVNDPSYRPEIWSLGLRNPWRFSFDPVTGDMWIGDVGQVTREEIDFEPAGMGGRNYGWRCYEGTFPFNTSGCGPASSYTGPIYDYDNNSVGCSVTGGMIYRGSKYSDLYGVYLFTDYCSGRWWATRQMPDGTFDTKEIANLANYQFASLGVDRDGELYVAATNSGTIYRIEERCSSFQVSGVVTNATCNGSKDGAIDLDLTGGQTPYSISWPDGSSDTLLNNLDPGAYIVEVQDAQGCIRTETFQVVSSAPVAAPALTVLAWTAPFPEPVLICDQDTVILEVPEAPAGMGYQWYQDGQAIAGATDRQLSLNTIGSYFAVYTDSPCNSEPSDTIVIMAPGVPVQPVVETSGASVLCSDDDEVLLTIPGVLPGFSIQWALDGTPIPNSNVHELTVTAPGAYTAQYVHGGCDLPVSNAVQVSQSQAPMILQNGDILSINGQFMSIQWQVYDYNTETWDDIPGANTNVYTSGFEGLFTVTVTDLLGCTYQAEPVGIASVRLPESVTEFSLAPNPASERVRLTLSLQQSERVQLVLRDLQQRIVYTKSVQGQRIREELDLSQVSAGTYYLQVLLESGNFVQPVVRK